MFDRLELVVGKDILKKISNVNILIVGVGGVGCICLESLVRSGFINITIIDMDKFEKSNLNRQLFSNSNNLDLYKVDEAFKRVSSINPNVNLTKFNIFLDESNISLLDLSKYDYVLDCCDSVSTKVLLMKLSKVYNYKIISSMGVGNRIDPTKLLICDIFKTKNDPLAKKVRNILKKNNIKLKIPVVCSLELPIKSGNIVGSSFFVPNAAGILMANYVFNDIIKNKVL